MVDMHTIGAGGGSIAWLDDGGMLQVGPESAGAHPGPACYGQGGTRATVTDANLVLGRLQSRAFLGGKMQLDLDAARSAIATLAAPLGLSIEETAAGIIQLADEHMAQALRVISIERGHDPKHFSLMPFGGAGGLHVCALAEALGMHRAIIPIHGGVLSALGMLVAPRSRELSRTLARPLAQCDAAELQQMAQALQQQAQQALAAEGVSAADIDSRFSLDLRYHGQAYHLNIRWQAGQSLHDYAQAFEAAHAQRYGHRLERAVEIVNLRCRAQARQLDIQLPPLAVHPTIDHDSCHLHGITSAVPLLQRSALAPQQQVTGPCVIVEQVATSYLAAGWQGVVDDYGNILLTRQA